MPKHAMLLLVVGIALAACAKEDDATTNKSTLTQREKDSVFANSTIPGARAVKKALSTADSATARQARIDSAQQSP
ncbi:MAG TPA: hypothetical protein VLJ83_07320 [Gemmatimonadaceae bacterium]|nr:hypothetical protein [Gemmatimonadaceae bacterium]